MSPASSVAPGCLRNDRWHRVSTLSCDSPRAVHWTYQDARRDVAAAANRDHEIRLEVIEDLGCCLLAQLVDLPRRTSDQCATAAAFTASRLALRALTSLYVM